MYEQSYGSAQSVTTEGTLLDNGISQMFNYVNGQESLIQEVEMRLHKILNRVLPPTDKANAPTKPSPIDFAQRFAEEVERIYANNLRLERIVKHLSEII